MHSRQRKRCVRVADSWRFWGSLNFDHQNTRKAACLYGPWQPNSAGIPTEYQSDEKVQDPIAAAVSRFQCLIRENTRIMTVINSDATNNFDANNSENQNNGQLGKKLSCSDLFIVSVCL